MPSLQMGNSRGRRLHRESGQLELLGTFQFYTTDCELICIVHMQVVHMGASPSHALQHWVSLLRHCLYIIHKCYPCAILSISVRYKLHHSCSAAYHMCLQCSVVIVELHEASFHLHSKLQQENAQYLAIRSSIPFRPLGWRFFRKAK
jgi:hypothetical protein